MSERSNCGYTIVQSLTIGDCEFVLGHNPEAPNPYVTRKCSNGDYYFWGHYSNDRMAADRDLLTRAVQELDRQEQRMGIQPKHKEKERER